MWGGGEGEGREACVLIVRPTHAEGGCQSLVNDGEEEHQNACMPRARAR